MAMVAKVQRPSTEHDVELVEYNYLQSKINPTGSPAMQWRYVTGDMLIRLSAYVTSGGTETEILGGALMTGGAGTHIEAFIGTTSTLVVPAGTGAIWGITARIKLTDGTIQADGFAAAGAASASRNASVALGATASVSAANFSVWVAGGTSIDSGVALDTATHRLRAWRTGGLTYFEIDGTVCNPSGTAAAFAPFDMAMWCGSYSGSGTGQKLETYDIGTLVAQV